MKILWSRLIFVVIVAPGIGQLNAEEFRWEGNCAPVFGWQQTCAGGQTNWNQGAFLPGPNDTIILLNGDPVTQPDFHITVTSVLADAPVLLDSGEFVTVTENSQFKNLQGIGGGIEARNGAMVSISGTSVINALRTDDSTGGFELTGEWSGEPALFGPVEVTSFGTGTVTSLSQFSAESSFTNAGTLRLLAGIQGVTAAIFNTNDIIIEGGGTHFVQPHLWNAGNITVQDAGTDISFQGQQTYFEGGTTVLAEDTVMTLNSLNGGVQIHQVLGTSRFQSLGLLDIFNSYDIKASVFFDLGEGSPTDGVGGTRLRSRLVLDAGVVVTNEPGARMRFWNGEITGDGRFVNLGEAYTAFLGQATFGVDVENFGTFSDIADPGGSSIIQDGAVFHNRSVVILSRRLELQGGTQLLNDSQSQVPAEVRMLESGVRLTGAGKMDNRNANLVLDVFDGERADVFVEFENHTLDAQRSGLVEVLGGDLWFRGIVANLDSTGVLRGGRWIVRNGSIRFPRTVTQIGDDSLGTPESLAWVHSNQPLPDFETLSVVAPTGRANFPGGQNFVGDLLIRNGGAMSGSALSVSGSFTIGDETEAIRAEFAATSDFDRDFGGDSLPAARTALAPVQSAELSVENLVNNGRLLPGDRGQLGQLELFGNYEQSAQASLHIDVASSGVDVLSVTGDTTISGTLEVSRIFGSDPNVGQAYTILVSTSTLSGEFSSVISSDPLTINYQPNAVTIEFLKVRPDMLFQGTFE